MNSSGNKRVQLCPARVCICTLLGSLVYVDSMQAQHHTAANAGPGASLYTGNLTICDPQLSRGAIETAIANKSDCTKAISQLKGNNLTNCSMLDETNTSTEYTADGNVATPLVTVGSCQVLLGAVNGQSLSCSQVAEYASNLATACSNSQMGTGGRVYPLPQGPSVERTAIVLSRITSRVTAFPRG